MELAVSQEMLARWELAQLFSARLSQYPFIQENSSTWVPVWLAAPFLDAFTTQSGGFLGRISSMAMVGPILPPLVVLLVYTFRAYRIRIVSTEAALVLGTCLAPQLLHLVAWDTARFWTLTDLAAFLALWVYAQLAGAHATGRETRLVCLGALAANAVVLTSLMDLETDHFGFALRLFLYVPVFLAGVALVLEGQGSPTPRGRGLRKSPADLGARLH